MGILTVYDNIVIAFFMLFMLAIGFVIKKFLHSSKDYFAGGQRVCWWLLGSSVFVSSFSSWTFTGAAGIAYKYGILILFTSYIPHMIGVIVGYLFFATRLRQLRVITGAEAIRRRFGKFNEQFFNWFGMTMAPFYPAVQLASLAMLLATVFQFEAVQVIWVVGIVVVVFTVIGGSWAVMASDFIQLLLVLIISFVVAAMCIIKMGGIGPMIDSIPAERFQVWYSLGEIKYDWLFVVGTIVSVVFFANGITNGRYFAARDGDHARWSALIPIICYIVMPVVWFLPPLACYAMVPNLAEVSRFPNPEEGAYIAVAMQVLPQGLMGLMVVGMLSATMSSLNTALNGFSAGFTWNFYRSILRPHASDREYLTVGVITTFVFGILVLLGAILFHSTKVSLFDAYMYLGAFIGSGTGVVMVLAFFIKRTPPWSAWATVLFSTILSFVIFALILGQGAQDFLTGQLNVIPVLQSGYLYLVKVPFVVTPLFIVPLTVAFFLLTKFFYQEGKDPEMDASVAQFYKDMETPVDFEREVGHDNTAAQAGMIGVLSLVYAGFITLMLLIPNDWLARLAILFCAAVLGGVGWILMAYRKKVLARDRANLQENS